ncbi:MAG: BolA family protein [Bdellovibrionales bacterium]
MGPIETSIINKLKSTYDPIYLEVENESHKHASQMGLESHFRVLIVSKNFEGIKRIDRSRNLHTTLDEELNKIHALALRVFTESEWEEKKHKITLSSPHCVSKGNTI